MGHGIDALEAHGLQVGREHGLDCSFPAALHDELLRQAPPLGERLRLKPVIHLLSGFTERRLLESFERR